MKPKRDPKPLKLAPRVPVNICAICQVVVAQGQVQLHRAVAEQPARAVPRPRQDPQGRELGARHARHPRLMRDLLLRGDHRLQGPRRLHGRRTLRPGG